MELARDKIVTGNAANKILFYYWQANPTNTVYLYTAARISSTLLNGLGGSRYLAMNL